MTKSDIYCEHANENPNYCKCPVDCVCQTNTCKDKGPNDCSSFSLAGAASDPCAKNQRRLRDLAKLAHEYGDENLRERLDPSRFGISCDEPLGLVSEEEAEELVVDNLTPAFLIKDELFQRLPWTNDEIEKSDPTVMSPERWTRVRGALPHLAGQIRERNDKRLLNYVVRVVNLEVVNAFDATALQVTFKLTPDLEIVVYYPTTAEEDGE